MKDVHGLLTDKLAPPADLEIDEQANSAKPSINSGLSVQASSKNWTSPERKARFNQIEALLGAEEPDRQQRLDLCNEKAMLLFEEQSFSDAVAAWDQGLAIEPNQVQSWYSRGIALDCLGSHELALESYDQVIELQPDHHLAWGNRAIALRKLGQHQAATEAARRAFELNPEDMVDSFFEQLQAKQPKLAFILSPIQSFVTKLRGG